MTENQGPSFDIEVFFDGGCPLCRREIGMIQRWDRNQRIRFTDIDSPLFHPERLGKSRDELMASMHGRLADGTWIQGVEVFRRMYAAVGFPKLAAMTRLPIIRHLLDWGYAVFARNRLRFTGRCTAESCATTQ